MRYPESRFGGEKRRSAARSKASKMDVISLVAFSMRVEPVGEIAFMEVLRV